MNRTDKAIEKNNLAFFQKRKVLSRAELKEVSPLSQRSIETRAECASLNEMMRSESHAFRSGKGRIAQYFQGLTQRTARINSRMRPARASEE